MRKGDGNSGMRKVSIKRELLNNSVREFREARVKQAGECWICGHSPKHPWRDKPAELSNLCVHEIANGPLRGKSLDKPYATLVLCWYCNGHVVTNKKVWPESRQLALLLQKSPQDYDLKLYNYLVNANAPNRITQLEVEQWTEIAKKQ